MSFDKPAENAQFRQNQGFEYPLLSDQDKALARHYGAIRAGIQPFASRVTVLLDPTGAIFESIPNDDDKPSAADHAKIALKLLDRR